MLIATREAALAEFPHLIASLPFIMAIPVALLGQIVAKHVSNMTFRGYQAAYSSDRTRLKIEAHHELQPGPLRDRTEWAIDAVQSVNVAFTPALGLAILHLSGVVDIWANPVLVSTPALATAFVFILLLVPPGRYRSLARWNVSGVTWVAVVTNTIGAVIAYCLTRPTS